MNCDYIKEELDLLLKDGLIFDYSIKYENEKDSKSEISQIKRIVITTIEKDVLEISLNDNFCYKIDEINNKKLEKFDNKGNDNNNNLELFEDFNTLLDKYSPNYRIKFNELLKAKLLKLQEIE